MLQEGDSDSDSNDIARLANPGSRGGVLWWSGAVSGRWRELEMGGGWLRVADDVEEAWEHRGGQVQRSIHVRKGLMAVDGSELTWEQF